MSVTVDREASSPDHPHYRPHRITDAQAAILWALREPDPVGTLSVGSNERGHWSCWVRGWVSPFGQVPIVVKKPTMRSLLEHQLIGPAVPAGELDLDQPPAVTGSNVVPLNFRRPQETPRARLAKWFMQLSTWISGDALERPAHAALIVLSGPHGHEITSIGHRSWAELREACQAAAGYTMGRDGKMQVAAYAAKAKLEITKAGRIALLAHEERVEMDGAQAAGLGWEAQEEIRLKYKPLWRELGRAGRW